MKFIDKIKDLFSDEEEVVETKEIEIEDSEEETPKEERKLPTFMRNKIEEEQKREAERKKREDPLVQEPVISDREMTRSRSDNSFAFPIDMDEPEEVLPPRYSNQNVLQREKSVAELYSKKEEPKPRKFKPTPVISPVYGILDKNYTKEDVKVQDEKSYELQRPSRKVDFETVRNKAFGNLTDDIKNNLCENCELYQEVKITKASELKVKTKVETDLLSDMKEDKLTPPKDISLGDAEDNYFDFGVDYEAPKKEPAPKSEPEDIDEIKIVNHNEEESTAEKIEVKEAPEEILKIEPLEEAIETEESADSVLASLDEVGKEEDTSSNDIFNLIDSVYEEEEK